MHMRIQWVEFDLELSVVPAETEQKKNTGYMNKLSSSSEKFQYPVRYHIEQRSLIRISILPNIM